MEDKFRAIAPPTMGQKTKRILQETIPVSRPPSIPSTPTSEPAETPGLCTLLVVVDLEDNMILTESHLREAAGCDWKQVGCRPLEDDVDGVAYEIHTARPQALIRSLLNTAHLLCWEVYVNEQRVVDTRACPTGYTDEQMLIRLTNACDDLVTLTDEVTALDMGNPRTRTKLRKSLQRVRLVLKELER